MRDGSLHSVQRGVKAVNGGIRWVGGGRLSLVLVGWCVLFFVEDGGSSAVFLRRVSDEVFNGWKNRGLLGFPGWKQRVPDDPTTGAGCWPQAHQGQPDGQTRLIEPDGALPENVGRGMNMLDLFIICPYSFLPILHHILLLSSRPNAPK